MLLSGFRKPLVSEDLSPLPRNLRVGNINTGDALQVDWDVKWPLGRALIWRFMRSYGYVFGLYTIYVLLNCLNPLLVQVLIRSVEGGSTVIQGNPVFTNAWEVVASMLAVALLQSTVKQNFFWQGLKAGITLRTVVMSSVYKKSLRMSTSRKRRGGDISITNLMAGDADTVLDFFWTALVYIFGIPLQIILLLVIVYYVIGPIGLIGFIPLASSAPLQMLLAKRGNRLRGSSRKKSDERVNLLTEVLQGIRVLKLYNWELPFKQTLECIRAEQLVLLFKSLQLDLWGYFATAVLPGLALAAVFTAYVYTGHTLTVSNAFTTLTLYNTMIEPLRQVQAVIIASSNFLISVKYLTTFLMGDEVQSQRSEKAMTLMKSSSSGSGKGTAQDVTITDATLMWDALQNKGSSSVPPDDLRRQKEMRKSALLWRRGVTIAPEISHIVIELDPPDRPALANFNFHAPAGKLTCIVGPVGCGKSALIQAILGEITLVSGTVSAPSEIAYTPQSPWLITASLQENILFGRPLNVKRYQDTIEACALAKDLISLPAGDRTEIGEKGLNLSGGQKQRVSLARALYANSQCYVMDEPLSAVDMHVATWLFENCITGMMGGTTRILITHQIQFLSRADMIVVMHEGQITHRGTYGSLMAQGVDFEDLINRKEIITKGGKHIEKDEPVPTDDGASEAVSSPEIASPDLLKGPTQEEKSQLISNEERQTGKVAWDVYRKYFAASGHFWLSILTLVLYILAQVASVLSSYWLTYWAGQKYNLPRHVYAIVFIALIVAYGLLQRLGLQGVLYLTCKAAATLHNRMLAVILGAKPSFFDTTPTGRIMNRFSKDQSILDQLIMAVLHDILSCCIIALCSVVTVCIVAPVLIPPCFLLAILFFFIQHFYRCTCRELKRLKSISYSGIFSVAAETMTGLSVVRAFKNEEEFNTVFNRKLDVNTQFIYNEFAVNRWLNMQLEWIAGIVVFLASAASIFLMDSLGAGLVGLMITTSLSMCGSLAWGVRQLSQMEVNMNSVERILHYCSTVPQETTSDLCPPPSTWPETGSIEIKDLVVQYRKDLDPVLCGISCSIKSGEKIGVVGRTGAGKSTLTSAIFRMVEASSGSIFIDGVNIYNIQLDVLRSCLAIIPQDPVLFSGSVRMNLDPFGNHSDEELWSTLAHVHLDHNVRKLDGQLSYYVKDTGEGFSVGQRQLLCIGRAILRDAKILVMDEATASLDFNTDLLIKKTVRECFAAKTTITIAHRLDTIMDSDRVMVFEQGKLAEYDNPTILLADPMSKFSLLVAAAQKSFKISSHRM